MRHNRFLEALKENANIAGITAITAASLATLNPVPILVGAVAEVAYLLFVPDSKWYADRLVKRSNLEAEKRRQEMRKQLLPQLPPEVQARYLRLEEMRRQIETQCAQGEVWYRDLLQKLDYLLDKFLIFANRDTDFRRYLSSMRRSVNGNRSANTSTSRSNRSSSSKSRSQRTDWVPDAVNYVEAPDMSEEWVRKTVVEVQSSYQDELANLQGLIDKEEAVDTKTILMKRLDVLTRRSEFVDRIGKILINMNHQLHLVEDTFGLIDDEIRARSPEQIMADIEEVVMQTDTMTKTLEEIAPYEQLAARM